MSGGRFLVVAVLILLAGCSGSDESTSAIDAADTAAPATAIAAEPPATAEPLATPEPAATAVPSAAPDSAEATDSSDQPAEESAAALQPRSGTPYPTSEPDPSSAWISRRSMSADEIEVNWSSTDGAVEYQLHRLEFTSDEEPDRTAMTDANRIHTVDGSVEPRIFLDTGVIAGTKYWYGLRGLDAGGTVTSVGWHRADAVTDVEPPSSPEVAVEVVDGAVQLSWSAPAENYELHNYQVLRGVDGEEPEVVANTWDLAQTSFVDDEPPRGVVVYQVTAMDFHWNRSEPATITLDLS